MWGSTADPLITKSQNQTEKGPVWAFELWWNYCVCGRAGRCLSCVLSIVKQLTQVCKSSRAFFWSVSLQLFITEWEREWVFINICVETGSEGSESHTRAKNFQTEPSVYPTMRKIPTKDTKDAPGEGKDEWEWWIFSEWEEKAIIEYSSAMKGRLKMMEYHIFLLNFFEVFLLLIFPS